MRNFRLKIFSHYRSITDFKEKHEKHSQEIRSPGPTPTCGKDIYNVRINNILRLKRRYFKNKIIFMLSQKKIFLKFPYIR